MSGTLLPQVISPQQASTIYSQTGAFPKQRNTFLVRFNMFTVSGGPVSNLTYAVKTFDRPNIQPTSEELNQYNKKRQVYTGYKKSGIKCSFYDDAQGSALTMWASYSRYYFGDFATGNDQGPFFDDISNGSWFDNGSGFGFTAQNGGNPNPNSQWYFSTINILHFHNNIYDLYTLVNPRITSFSPDELDFGNSEVAMINAEFVYEAVIFTPNTGSAASQPEFSGLYNGNTQGTAIDNYSSEPTNPGIPAFGSSISGAFAGVDQYFSSLAGNIPSSMIPNSNYYNTSTGSGLSAFGSFGFGVNNPSVLSSANLITAPLNLNANGNPLATYGNIATSGAAFTGVPPLYPGTVTSVAGAMSTTYGTIGQQVAQAAYSGGFSPANGFSLSPTAMSVLNSQAPSGVQYGVNANIPQLQAVASQINNPLTAQQLQTAAAYFAAASPGLPTPANPKSAPSNANPYSGDTDAETGVPLD